MTTHTGRHRTVHPHAVKQQQPHAAGWDVIFGATFGGFVVGFLVAVVFLQLIPIHL